MSDPPHPFVGRGGLKLSHALETFRIDAVGRLAVDLGCNVGGFTDCLLQRGAVHVIAIDTGYGMLAWRLRQDALRVTVGERTNALHTDPDALVARAHAAMSTAPQPALPPVSLVVADMGWTPQRHLLPAALRFLGRPGTTANVSDAAGHAGGIDGVVIALVKPHYEAEAAAGGGSGRLRRGVVIDEAQAETIARNAAEAAATASGALLAGFTRSPILGGEGKGRRGNVEFLALYRPAATRPPAPA